MVLFFCSFFLFPPPPGFFAWWTRTYVVDTPLCRTSDAIHRDNSALQQCRYVRPMAKAFYCVNIFTNASCSGSGITEKSARTQWFYQKLFSWATWALTLIRSDYQTMLLTTGKVITKLLTAVLNRAVDTRIMEIHSNTLLSFLNANKTAR